MAVDNEATTEGGCKPKRPKKVILFYDNGELEIDLDVPYYEGMITALFFSLRGASGSPNCDQQHPGKWKKKPVAGSGENEEDIAPGCCYVDGKLVCWD